MVYHHELSQQLKELGHSIDWNRNGTFDIVGFKSEDLKQFSSRRTEILNVAGENSHSKAKASACVSTRNTKKYVNAQERKALRESWQHKFNSLELSFPQTSTPKNRVLSNDKQHQLRHELINRSIQSLNNRDGKTRFLKHELLKEVLLQAKGQHQLDKLQHDIKQHPSLIPIENKMLTTIKLYQEERAKIREDYRHGLSSGKEPNVLKLATSTLSNQSPEYSELQPNSERFSLQETRDGEQKMAQTLQDYLQRDEYQQSETIILTDTEQDKIQLTSHIREKLIQQNKLGNNSLKTIILQPTNLDKHEISQPQNYQVGNAIKFNRQSARFSNQRFYKVLSIDEKNQVLHLGDRFNNQVELPLNRYQNREVFKVQRRELRINEKMRFNRSHYVNGKQVTASQSFVITNIQDQQRITIKTKGKQSIVKASNLFFAEYNYAATLKEHQNQKIEHCIYHPSKAKSKQLFQQDIYEVASRTKVQLTVYTSDNFLRSQYAIKANSSPQKMKFNNQPQPQSVEKSDKSSIRESETLDIDNTLFELVSSAKYIVLNRDLDSPAPENIQVYNSPDGVMIEKDSQNLSIYYDGRLLKFDQDFNVISNLTFPVKSENNEIVTFLRPR